MSEGTELHIEDGDWAPAGEKDLMTRLLTTVYINGVPHHLEAIAVEVEDDNQKAADPAFESKFEGLCAMDEADGHYQTTEILGRKYVLAMTPFC